MTTKQSFFEATKLNNIFNKVIDWNGYTLGVVGWHNDREWKLLDTGVDFDTAKERDYKPIAEFHTQQELWGYISKVVQ